MTLLRKRLGLLILGFIILILTIAAIIYIVPFKGFGAVQKPEQPYEYYYVYAEEDGRELMRVPVAISIGDELITEENKRYRVITVSEDKGIARYVEMVNLEEYRPK